MGHLAFRARFRLAVYMHEHSPAGLAAIRFLSLGRIAHMDRRRILPMLRISRVNDFSRRFKVLSQNVFHHCRRHQFRLLQCFSEQEMTEFGVLG